MKITDLSKIWNDLKNRDPTCPAFVCCLPAVLQGTTRTKTQPGPNVCILLIGSQVEIKLDCDFGDPFCFLSKKCLCLCVCICDMHALIFAASVRLNVHLQKFAGFVHVTVHKDALSHRWKLLWFACFWGLPAPPVHTVCIFPRRLLHALEWRCLAALRGTACVCLHTNVSVFVWEGRVQEMGL